MSTTKKTRQPGQQFAVCVDYSGYPASLELHKIYQVLRDEEAAHDGDLRIIDESGEGLPLSRAPFHGCYATQGRRAGAPEAS